MKYRISAVFVLITFFFASAQKIYWSENRKLTWSDFQSRDNLGHDFSVVAFANVGMGYSAETTTNPKAPVSIEVSVYFDTQRSWKVDNIKGDRVLLHEQKHFDIAEVYGRKLRQLIAANIKNSLDYQNKFVPLYKENLAQYKSFQKKYDSETNHGLNEEKQMYYNSFIAEELKKLNKFRKN
ncbi:DUF922 domain-containing protein [Chryseobacterium caseinilyticum]|uniref:DUF922 domain-containing protein n=1 Tax=Chryseobacterium caseinilyticum TaxID=2771428 RepID=A0ABR8Z916_9FLAO|nr:DUF922 domain-containing protein [Chryseobacterium caseinilyticum]MBD8081717.1 DUF922 domain-containing protein [Chryseobacterium caseinilyticum]